MSNVFVPQGGYVGAITYLGNVLQLFEWDYEDDMDVQNAPAFNQVAAARGPLSTVGYMSHTPGLITGWCAATGVWNQLFNPNANNMKVGNVGALALNVNNVVLSSSPNAILKRMHVSSKAPGQVLFSAFWIYDENFSDFANTNA